MTTTAFPVQPDLESIAAGLNELHALLNRPKVTRTRSGPRKSSKNDRLRTAACRLAASRGALTRRDRILLMQVYGATTSQLSVAMRGAFDRVQPEDPYSPELWQLTSDPAPLNEPPDEYQPKKSRWVKWMAERYAVVFDSEILTADVKQPTEQLARHLGVKSPAAIKIIKAELRATLPDDEPKVKKLKGE